MGSLTRSGCMDVDDSIGGFNLIWADFPTSLALSNVGNATLTWNVFGEDLVESAFTLVEQSIFFGMVLWFALYVQSIWV